MIYKLKHILKTKMIFLTNPCHTLAWRKFSRVRKYSLTSQKWAEITLTHASKWLNYYTSRNKQTNHLSPVKNTPKPKGRRTGTGWVLSVVTLEVELPKKQKTHSATMQNSKKFEIVPAKGGSKAYKQAYNNKSSRKDC